MTIDFHTYTLRVRSGKEVPMTDAYMVMASSLKSHRHRKGEILALLLDINPEALLSAEEIEGLLAETRKTFFNTPGSVTNAIQCAAGVINSEILSKNIHSESGESLGVGINIAVLHNGYLFNAQAGMTHALVINAESVMELTQANLNERGLGLSRRFFLNFKQSVINPGDVIILTSTRPSFWTDAFLAECAVLGMDDVHKRLIEQVEEDQTALVIKCREGKGVVAIEHWAEKQPSTTVQPSPKADEEEAEPVEIEADLDVEAESGIDEISDEPEFMDSDKREEPAFPDEFVHDQVEDIPIKAGQTEKATPIFKEQAPLSTQHKPQDTTQEENVVVEKIKDATTSVQDGIKGFLLKLGKRVAPPTDALEGKISTKVMSVIVVAIPALLVVTAILVYVYSGKREQHQTFLEEAQTYISQAATIEEVDQQREYWVKAYEAVLNAMEFGDSDLASNLLVQTQTIIDEMDLVTRLDFRPATTSQFANDVVLAVIKSNDSGIYLLDDENGKIFRIEKTSKGFYEVDNTFQCSPGTYGVVTLGKIVDFTMLPTNTRGYELLAIDASGNLLYCQPDEAPVAGSIIPPDDEWGRIAALSLDEYTLYVVDAETDRIWSYSGRDFEITTMAGIFFSSHPVDYLGTEEVDLGGVIDLIVNKEDVFVLHEDTHMTTCQYNAYRADNATECQDPTAYSDSRIGYEKNPLIFFDSSFRVIQETTYPSAAFFVLDNGNRAILQFSYQLNLEGLLKPQPSKTYPLPEKDMTGLGVSTEKEIFLAFGNQLYVGELP